MIGTRVIVILIVFSMIEPLTVGSMHRLFWSGWGIDMFYLFEIVFYSCAVIYLVAAFCGLSLGGVAFAVLPCVGLVCGVFFIINEVM